MICRGRNTTHQHQSANTQIADILLLEITAEHARQSSLFRFDGDKDSLKMEYSATFASDSVKKNKRKSEARSSVRCWIKNVHLTMVE